MGCDPERASVADTSCDFTGSCGAAAVLNDGYDYDGNGNVAAISDGRTLNRGNRTMSYDGLDRLKTVVSPMFGNAAYAYNTLDDMTRVTIGGTAARDHYYCYDAHFRLTNVKTGSCAGTSVIGLGYDERGNLANKNGATYAFDYGNRLRGVAHAGTYVETYRYDGLGRRALSWSPTLGNLFSQYSRSGQLMYQSNTRIQKAYEYLYLGGSLVATRERDVATNTYAAQYQHTDALGSPVAVTDANRVVIEKNEYEPYGKVINHALKDGPGYTGHVADAATGLIYMQQRYYDDDLGKFPTVDPVTATSVGGNFNRYWYANNNPYRFTDPDGRIVKAVGSQSDIDKINKDIEKIKSKPEGAEAYKKLNESKNVYEIKVGRRISTTPSDSKKAENKESVGATITYDPKSIYGGKNSEGSRQRPAFVDLAHEFGHALALDAGAQSFDRGNFKPGTTPPSEEQSMELENAVRKEHSLPTRPSYYFSD